MLNEYDINNYNSIYKFKQDLISIINPAVYEGLSIIFYFIGTDRCTGDSLGPIAGEKFKNLIYNNIYFFGSLESPVHAVNINEIVRRNEILHKHSLIISVDASLGSKNNVGKVILQNKPVKPGSALNKNISTIGDYSITGIVNYSDKLDFIILQNTRLYNVFKLSRFISEGIYMCLETNSQKSASDNFKCPLK